MSNKNPLPQGFDLKTSNDPNGARKVMRLAERADSTKYSGMTRRDAICSEMEWLDVERGRDSFEDGAAKVLSFWLADAPQISQGKKPRPVPRASFLMMLLASNYGKMVGLGFFISAVLFLNLLVEDKDRHVILVSMGLFFFVAGSAATPAAYKYANKLSLLIKYGDLTWALTTYIYPKTYADGDPSSFELSFAYIVDNEIYYRLVVVDDTYNMDDDLYELILISSENPHIVYFCDRLPSSINISW